MADIKHYAALLEAVNVTEGVKIDSRLYCGSVDQLKELKALDEIYQVLSVRDIFDLYDQDIGHDGMHPEDIYKSGRYYAYLRFELKGQAADEKEEMLCEALKEEVEKFGKENIVKYFPVEYKGRQVTQDINIRPEDEDYPSYYSETRRDYAWKMAGDEFPAAILSKIRGDQEDILDRFDWNTLFVADPDGELIDICGNVYLAPKDKISVLKPFEEIWNSLLSKGADFFYNDYIATDGEYPVDEHNPYGRYYAYIKLEMNGLSTDEKLESLQKHLPDNAVEKLGLETIKEIFPLFLNGKPVTQPLTIRPEEDEYQSNYNKKKVESGKKQIYKQVLYDIQAEIISRIENVLGGINKVIILEDMEN